MIWTYIELKTVQKALEWKKILFPFEYGDIKENNTVYRRSDQECRSMHLDGNMMGLWTHF